MPNFYNIQEFYGIQQHKDGSLLPTGTACDARNVDTSDGNLRLAKGFEKHISFAVGGTDKILKLIPARTSAGTVFYVVTADKIYVQDTSTWTAVYTFTVPAVAQVDYLQTKIGTDDYLIVATGKQQMVKIKLANHTASLFGTGSTTFTGTVSSYDAGTLSVTLSDELSDDALRHALSDGISINNYLHAVASASNTGGAGVVVLKDEPATAPEASDTVSIRGGGSTASCNYIDMYYSRLFSAGDPNAPSRLYWSAVAGNGRTIEDWLSVEGSVDASGGYVEVGDSDGDSILGFCVLSSSMLIFKQHSIWRLYGNRPSSYTLERVENTAETMSNASVIIKYDSPQWLTKDGIMYYDGTGVIPMNGGQKFLRNFVESIVSVSNSKGCYADNKLYYTCKVKNDSTYDDSIICYDIARQSFMIRDGFEVADIVADDGDLYIINGNRYVYKFLSGYTYDGNPINAYWNTQPTDLLQKYAKKQIKEILFRGKTGRIFFTIRDGAAKSYVRKDLFADNDGFVSVPSNTDLARVFEILIQNEQGSYFEITGGMDIIFEKEYRAKS